jgi:hypothetical protein
MPGRDDDEEEDTDLDEHDDDKDRRDDGHRARWVLDERAAGTSVTRPGAA